MGVSRQDNIFFLNIGSGNLFVWSVHV